MWTKRLPWSIHQLNPSFVRGHWPGLSPPLQSAITKGLEFFFHSIPQWNVDLWGELPPTAWDLPPSLGKGWRWKIRIRSHCNQGSKLYHALVFWPQFFISCSFQLFAHPLISSASFPPALLSPQFSLTVLSKARNSLPDWDGSWEV